MRTRGSSIASARAGPNSSQLWWGRERCLNQWTDNQLEFNRNLHAASSLSDKETTVGFEDITGSG